MALLSVLHKPKGLCSLGDIALKGQKIVAQSVWGGLRESLNTEAGGELAHNLDNLYVYIQRILTNAQQNDIKLLDEAATLLGELQSASKQIG